MNRMPATLAALGSRSGLRRAVLAYALFGLVELGTWFAMVLYAFAAGGPRMAGLVAVIEVLPAAFLAPVLSGYVERLPRGTALVLGYSAVATAAGITMVTLVFEAPLAVVVTFASLTVVTIATVRPVHFAALPQLSRSPEELVSGNALATISDGLALFAGPILAGILSQSVGTWLAFAVACVVALTAAALCLNLGLAKATTDELEEEGPPEWRAAIDGVLDLWGNWAALALLIVMATRFIVAGASDILGVTFSEEVLGLGESGAGTMLAGLGIGALVGGAMAASFAVRRTLAPVVGLSGAVLAISLAGVAFAVILPPAMALLAFTGLGGSLLMVSGRTLLARTTDEKLLARVFAVQEGTSLLGVAVGAALAPIAVELLHPSGAFAFFGIALALLTIVGFLFIRQLDARAVLRPDEIALLRKVPFLAVLPAYELERLARKAVWLDVPAGEDVIVQGEPGDLFYVIDSGEFDVTIDGTTKPQPLGPGEGFGEIALLWSIPRTATITSRTAGRLLTVDGEDFLAAVTGSEDGRAIAEEVTNAYLARGLSPASD
jgi:hypothetical protein